MKVKDLFSGYSTSTRQTQPGVEQFSSDQRGAASATPSGPQLDDLPDDLHRAVLAKLPPSAVRALSAQNKYWHGIASSQSFKDAYTKNSAELLQRPVGQKRDVLQHKQLMRDREALALGLPLGAGYSVVRKPLSYGSGTRWNLDHPASWESSGTHDDRCWTFLSCMPTQGDAAADEPANAVTMTRMFFCVAAAHGTPTAHFSQMAGFEPSAPKLVVPGLKAYLRTLVPLGDEALILLEKWPRRFPPRTNDVVPIVARHTLEESGKLTPLPTLCIGQDPVAIAWDGATRAIIWPNREGENSYDVLASVKMPEEDA